MKWAHSAHSATVLGGGDRAQGWVLPAGALYAPELPSSSSPAHEEGLSIRCLWRLRLGEETPVRQPGCQGRYSRFSCWVPLGCRALGRAGPGMCPGESYTSSAVTWVQGPAPALLSQATLEPLDKFLSFSVLWDLQQQAGGEWTATAPPGWGVCACSVGRTSRRARQGQLGFLQVLQGYWP